MDISTVFMSPVQPLQTGNSAIPADNLGSSQASDQFCRLLAEKFEMCDLRQGGAQAANNASLLKQSVLSQQLSLPDRPAEDTPVEGVIALKQKAECTEPTPDNFANSDDNGESTDITAGEDSVQGEAHPVSMFFQWDRTAFNVIPLDCGGDEKRTSGSNPGLSEDSMAPTFQPDGVINRLFYGEAGTGQDSSFHKMTAPVLAATPDTGIARMMQTAQSQVQGNGQDGLQATAIPGQRTNWSNMAAVTTSAPASRPQCTVNVFDQDKGSELDGASDLQGGSPGGEQNQQSTGLDASQSAQRPVSPRILPGEMIFDPMPRTDQGGPFGETAITGKEPQQGENTTGMNSNIPASIVTLPPVHSSPTQKIPVTAVAGQGLLKEMQGDSKGAASVAEDERQDGTGETENAIRVDGDENPGQLRSLNMKPEGILHPERITLSNQNPVQQDAGLKDPLHVAGRSSLIEGLQDAKTGEEQTLAAGRSGDTRSRGKDAKPVTLETSTLFVHGQGEARGVGDRGTVTTGEVKIPSADQIHQQVREKIESGDYAGNRNSITLKLNPEELGELKINLRLDDQRLKVEIVTENRSVKDALVQNLDTLKETLSRQNIAMDRFDVSADLRQGFNQPHREGNRMMQDNRGTNPQYQTAMAAEEKDQPALNYGWTGEESLVSLVL